MKQKAVVVLCAVLLILVVGKIAQADDAFVTTDFASWDVQYASHEDADPWKGWFNLTVTNNMPVAWGDFHFEIYSPMGYDISNVDFVVAAPYQPVIVPARPMTWVVDNNVVGATLDLYFYANPVLPGQTAQFIVYTDNTTDNVPFFGVMFHPTPVPEPASLLLLVAGGLIAKLRKK